MGSSLLEFQSFGDHGCNREAKVNEEVRGCGKMGCPDCEAKRAVEAFLRAGVGSFEKASFIHWPGTDTEVVDEYTLVPQYDGAPSELPFRLKVTRRHRDFYGNIASTIGTKYASKT
jgi:hypothetical protein